MAITTVDGVLAGAQPNRFFHKAITPTMVIARPQSLWGLGGIPGAGSFDTTLDGVTLSSTSALVNGQLPFYDPASGQTYLSRFSAHYTAGGGFIWLADRIWHNGGFTITSNAAQSITSPAWPSRDEDGATAGKGVLLGLEISAVAGAAAPTITVSYTNSDNTSGRSATNTFATANSPTAGAFFPIGLQAGDRGVKSVQSLTLSTSWVSGTMNLVAYRIIAGVDLAAGSAGQVIDVLTGNMSKMYAGTVPFLILAPSATTAGYVSGHLGVTQG